MAIEIKAPTYPESSISEATVAVWHKKPGEFVEIDDVIVEIETDKVVLEVPAEEAGILTEILAKEGETVGEQQVLALLDDEAKSTAATKEPKEEVKEVKAEEPIAPKQESVQEIIKETIEEVAAPEPIKEELKIPAVNNNVPLSGEPAVLEPLLPDGERVERRVPMTRMRARIAERLLDVTQTTASLTTFNEVDMSAMMSLRKQYQDEFTKMHNGTRLGFMGLFVKAAVEALKRFPLVNASIDGSDIVYHGYQDIGVAVSTERGLVVPVLRNAENMSIATVENAISSYAGKARDGKLTIDEMTGGTFTITNGGVYGSLLSTPILNPPQSAILGMHKIQERAMAVSGAVVVRPMMYLALSYDHRLIDGKEAVQFLVAIKELIEDPAKILLEI